MLLSENKRLRAQHKWIMRVHSKKNVGLWVFGNAFLGMLCFMFIAIPRAFLWNTIGMLIFLPALIYTVYATCMLNWIKEVEDIVWLCEDYFSETERVRQEIENETLS